MKDSPFFYSWTAQSNAIKVPLEEISDYGFKSNGRDLIDMSSLSYQASFGLRNKTIRNEIQKQMNEFCLASPKNTFSLKEEISQTLTRKASKGSKREYRAFFTLSGSESIENALKMARQISKKNYILCLSNSYHGASLGALSITGDWRNQNHLSLSQYSIRVPSSQEDPDSKQLEAIIKKNKKRGIAAICIETITGGNGVFVPTKRWYKRLQELCKEHQILLILDEVVCGAHRTGPFFGFQNYKGLKPDFVCLAKAITGGYFPMGAVLVREKRASFYDHNVLSCGLTNYAHPLGLAAMKGVFKLTKQKSFSKRLEVNTSILSNFKKTAEKVPCVSQIRQKGMLMAIDSKVKLDIQSFIDSGVFVAIQNNRLILAPSLIIPTKKLEQGLTKIEAVLRENK